MPEAGSTFIVQLAASIAATVSQLIGTEVRRSSEPEEQVPEPEIWCTSQLRDDSLCQLAIGTSRQTALLLARAMLSEAPGADAELTQEDQELLAEFWKQVLGRATTDLKSLLNEDSIDYLGAQAPEWPTAGSEVIRLQSEKADLSFLARLSAEMTERFLPSEDAAEDGSLQSYAAETNNLDLLLDVPLSVTLRFGQRPMPLREILQLTSGSVVELDRQADDAVDLLLDERLIARGQVVVVDGCYGLRVTEVVR